MENLKKTRIKSNEMEVEGKTVEEAVERASILLKVPKSELKIKVLSEEKKGLFGMEGGKPAKVRATVLRQNTSFKKNH